MSRASPSPEIAFGQKPISRPTRSRKSSPFLASRTAEVATAIVLSTPCVRAIRLYFRSTSSPRRMAVAEIRPRERVDAPSLTISFSPAMTRKPPRALVSTITMWNELLPRSMAAIFMPGEMWGAPPRPPLYSRPTGTPCWASGVTPLLHLYDEWARVSLWVFGLRDQLLDLTQDRR